MNAEPYDERRLQLVREADGEDARTYCPPLDAPMSVHIRHASPYGITDENAPRVRRAIFRDDAERKDFGAALAVWACVMGGGILLAYILHWVWTALTGGV